MASRDSLSVLMKEYALQGLRDWQGADPKLRNRAKTCLGNKIVGEEDEFNYEIFKTSHDKFFPMPKGMNEKELKYCFFRTNGKKSFELFILVKESTSLAFRFEPADAPEWRHNYAHVQFCRKMEGKQICPAEIPSWIPDSYPAFPLPSSDPLKLFLSMLTSVHGRSDGIEKIFREIFQKASQTGKIKTYLDILNGMLNA